MKVLKNKLRQMRSFNLDSRFHSARTANTPPGRPEAITFLALERKGVEDAVLGCTEIKAALKAGTLRDVTPEPKAETKPAAPEPVDEPADEPADEMDRSKVGADE